MTPPPIPEEAVELQRLDRIAFLLEGGAGGPVPWKLKRGSHEAAGAILRELDRMGALYLTEEEKRALIRRLDNTAGYGDELPTLASARQKLEESLSSDS